MRKDDFNPFDGFRAYVSENRNLPKPGADFNAYLVYWINLIFGGIWLLLIGICLLVWDILVPFLRLIILATLIIGVLDYFGVINAGKYLPKLSREKPQTSRPFYSVESGKKHHLMIEPLSKPKTEPHKPEPENRKIWPLILAALGGAVTSIATMLIWTRVRKKNHFRQ